MKILKQFSLPFILMIYNLSTETSSESSSQPSSNTSNPETTSQGLSQHLQQQTCHSPCIPKDIQVTWGLRTRCRQRMPMLSVWIAVTQRQTDYKTFRRSLTDALGHPVSRSWPSSSHCHQMRKTTVVSTPGHDARSSLSQKKRREGMRNKLSNLTLKLKLGPWRTVLCFPERSLWFLYWCHS